MLSNTIESLKKIIDESTIPVVVLVCDPDRVYTQYLDPVYNNRKNEVTLLVMEYTEDIMPFPRVQMDVLYFFAPKNQTPLFWRSSGQIAQDVSGDIDTVIKMVSGIDYVNARFTPKEAQDYINSEKNVKQDISKYPSAFQMARNLTKEIWKTGKNAAKGLPIIVDADTGFARLSTCEGCEFYQADAGRCTKCGCFMKTKTQLASASCPIGKWGEHTV